MTKENTTGGAVAVIDHQPAARHQTPALGNAMPGGLMLSSMDDVYALAQMMCKGGVTVPECFHGKPGACAGVIMQAVEWGMNPYSLANVAYVVSGKIGYEAKMFATLVNTRAPMQRRLRYEFTGELRYNGGETITKAGQKRGLPTGDMQCTVTGWLIGEDEPFIYTSPPIGEIQPKNSSMWNQDPRRQLMYYSARAWARLYVPEIIMGVYTSDELLDAAPPPETGPKRSSLMDKLDPEGQPDDEPAPTPDAEPEPDPEPVDQKDAAAEPEAQPEVEKGEDVASQADADVENAFAVFRASLADAETADAAAKALANLKGSSGAPHFTEGELEEAERLTDEKMAAILES